MKHAIERIMKDMHLPSGRQSGLPMFIGDDWSTEQAVAVAELLEDLLHLIHSRYQGELYAYWKSTRITEVDVDRADDDEGLSF
ncbi:MAG: hypothetical protein GW848_06160 [Rhodoferax sp.]|nr:hypothetical protein [Rhodoferax sp.]PIW09456.1 MAG: hypothetical protein COW39_04890 [Comamonadaceae bacterium CG17_big_fil_post_rev_8_21_14_2_50_60_13]